MGHYFLDIVYKVTNISCPKSPPKPFACCATAFFWTGLPREPDWDTQLYMQRVQNPCKLKCRAVGAETLRDRFYSLHSLLHKMVSHLGLRTGKI